jgi:hypothetical protein
VAPHFLCFITIVAVIGWGVEGRRDVSGAVTMGMVIALAMLPFLTHGKPWSAWRMYAFVAAIGAATAASQYVRPSPWIGVVLPLAIGTAVALRHRLRR